MAYIHRYIYTVLWPAFSMCGTRCICHSHIYTCIQTCIHTYIHTQCFGEPSLCTASDVTATGYIHTYIHTYIQYFGEPSLCNCHNYKYTYKHAYMHTYLQYFGESSLCTASDVTATNDVVCKDYSEIYLLSQEDLLEVCIYVYVCMYVCMSARTIQKSTLYLKRICSRYLYVCICMHVCVYVCMQRLLGNIPLVLMVHASMHTYKHAYIHTGG